MERFVKLEGLPEGLTVPAGFASRMRYDAANRRLVFQGFMSKADFDKLCLLSESWAYRRALEELFRLCTLEHESRPRALNRIKGILSHFGLL